MKKEDYDEIAILMTAIATKMDWNVAIPEGEFNGFVMGNKDFLDDFKDQKLEGNFIRMKRPVLS